MSVGEQVLGLCLAYSQRAMIETDWMAGLSMLTQVVIDASYVMFRKRLLTLLSLHVGCSYPSDSPMSLSVTSVAVVEEICLACGLRVPIFVHRLQDFLGTHCLDL